MTHESLATFLVEHRAQLERLASNYGLILTDWVVSQDTSSGVVIVTGSRKMACYEEQLGALQEQAQKFLRVPVRVMSHGPSRKPEFMITLMERQTVQIIS